jgi:hypothetical protein
LALKKGYARVFFSEDAYAEDILRCGRNGAAVLRETRSRYEREGVEIATLRSCEAEERDGTKLPGCFKVYLPVPAGKFGMVLRFTIPKKAAKRGSQDAKRRKKEAPRLRSLAFGIRHHPKGSHAETVYQVAHRRLHG